MGSDQTVQPSQSPPEWVMYVRYISIALIALGGLVLLYSLYGTGSNIFTPERVAQMKQWKRPQWST
jgi:hypothetical protein